jgi:hypothetical protein
MPCYRGRHLTFNTDKIFTGLLLANHALMLVIGILHITTAIHKQLGAQIRRNTGRNTESVKANITTLNSTVN